MAGQLNIKLLVASVHNLTVLSIFFDFIFFCLLLGSCNFLAQGFILKNIVFDEKNSSTCGNFPSPRI